MALNLSPGNGLTINKVGSTPLPKKVNIAPSAPVTSLPSGGFKAQDPASKVPVVNKTLPANQIKTNPTPQNQVNTNGTPQPFGPNGSTLPGGNAPVQQNSNTIDSSNLQQKEGVTQPALQPSNLPKYTAGQTGLYGQLIADLANRSNQPSAQYTQAYDKAQDINSQLSQSKVNLANELAKNQSNPIPLEFQQGRGQIIQNQGLAQQNALASELQGQTNLISGANTQQGLLQQALQQASSMAAPQLGQYGQTYYQPQMIGQGGSAGGQGGVQPSDPFYSTLKQYAQMAVNNQMSAIPSSITGNPVLNAQIIQMAKEINPSFNYNSAIGVGSAQQSNANLSGTATPNAYASIYESALRDYSNLQQSVQNVDQFGSLLTSNMASGGINPSDVKYANKTLAEIRGQLSSGAQAQYDTTLAALRSKISGMLSVGGNETPTAVTNDAQKILDGSLPLSQLNGVLGRIAQEGQILMQSQAEKVNTAKTGIGGSGGASGGGSNDPLGIRDPR